MSGVIWNLTRLAAQVVLALAFAATAATDTAHGWPPFVDELGVALFLLALAGQVVGPARALPGPNPAAPAPPPGGPRHPVPTRPVTLPPTGPRPATPTRSAV